jgi:hypothetical protein
VLSLLGSFGVVGGIFRLFEVRRGRSLKGYEGLERRKRQRKHETSSGSLLKYELNGLKVGIDFTTSNYQAIHLNLL